MFHEHNYIFQNFPYLPVAMLSVHTYPTIEAGVSGIGAAGLVALVPSRAGTHGCGLQSHRHQTHRSGVHHHGSVPNIQNTGAATGPSTAGTGALVDTDLKDDDLQEGLQLQVRVGDRKSRHQLKQINSSLQYHYSPVYLIN